MNELQVRLCPIDQLVPYKENARTHSEEQIAQIAASIQEFDWTFSEVGNNIDRL